MKRTLYGILALVLLLGAFLAGSWHESVKRIHDSTAAGRKILYYVDPMHPAYKSDKPGIAPDCGMELVPVYEDGSMGGPGGSPPGPAGTVAVGLEKQQLIGVKVGDVTRKPITRVLRALGRVVADETRLYRVTAYAQGWIEEALLNSAGSLVRRDEVLATFYAREFLAAQQAYFYALDARDRFLAQKASDAQMASTNVQIQQSTDTLRGLGMTTTQIQELAHTRERTYTIEIRSPATGFILVRNVSKGQRFQAGDELYRIADIARIWVLADIFKSEAEHLTPGTVARVSLPEEPKTYGAKVSEVLPQFDDNSRTLKIRLEMDNPGYTLRPGMFVDVEFPVQRPPAITVPADAVVDSGTKKTVYVVKGDGVFEPRRVETGWRAGNQVEIVKGLMPGEKIVVSGAFLIDSESRMKAAAAGMYGETDECPVCGMDVDQTRAKAAGLTSEFRGQTYYFCADEDKVKFDKEPMKYTWKSDKGPATPAGKRMSEVQWEGGKAKEKASAPIGHANPPTPPVSKSGPR